MAAHNILQFLKTCLSDITHNITVYDSPALQPYGTLNTQYSGIVFVMQPTCNFSCCSELVQLGFMFRLVKDYKFYTQNPGYINVVSRFKFFNVKWI